MVPGATGLVEPCDIVLCEELGYPEERIVKGTVSSPPEAKSGMFSLVIGNLERG